MAGEKDKMSCAEFQELLPSMFEDSGEQADHQHLRDCDSCANLVADLRYIAEQAKLLLPMRDPSPRVWEGIESSLRKDPIVPQTEAGTVKKMTSAADKKWKVVVMAAAISTGILLLLSSTGRQVQAAHAPAPQATHVAQ